MIRKKWRSATAIALVVEKVWILEATGVSFTIATKSWRLPPTYISPPTYILFRKKVVIDEGNR